MGYAARSQSPAVARLALVKADKARALEDRLIAMARSGQIREAVQEEQLISMLETMTSVEAKPKIMVRASRPCCLTPLRGAPTLYGCACVAQIKRKTVGDSDDDADDDDDLL